MEATHRQGQVEAPATLAGGARRGGKTLRAIKHSWRLYVLLALPMLYLIVFQYYPMYGVQVAFRDFNVGDGASKLRRIWHVDLPGITPIMVILFILDLGSLLSIGFEKVLLLQNPLNIDASEVIGTYTYRIGLASAVPQFSDAAAIGLFQSVVGLILIVAANQVARRARVTSLW